jgi:hypothetical protein
VDAIRLAILRVLAAERPASVRQVYYQLVGLGIVAKTEQEYKGTVCRLLAEMRLSGEIPFGWIADNTRWMRKPASYGGLEDALRRTAEAYRRSLWDRSPSYVEVWLEKDALAGVLFEETQRYDVPLMVTRGYPSLSYLYEAATAITANAQAAYLYYFGDYDPSGVDIARNVETRLRAFAPGATIHFERAAVNRDQIAALGLPTRPTKRTDSRAATFAEESVEVDAIPPDMLRAMVRDRIERHVDPHALRALALAEASERELLHALAAQVAGEAE